MPGRHLNFKFRKLLSWLGADENTVRRLVIEAIRIKDMVAPEQVRAEPEAEIEFKPRSLPENTMSFREWTTFIALQSEEYTIPEQLVQ